MAAALPAAAGAAHILVIGDSLSEEYGFEIPFSAPDSDPTDANTANWVEILANWRNSTTGADYCYFGDYEPTLGFYLDLRDAGYDYNFGIPAYKITDWLGLLAADSPTDGILYDTRNELLGQLPYVSAVVIMLGGNDLKAQYDRIFNGTEPANFFTLTVTRLMNIANFIANRPLAPPVILCTIPDVGVTPSVAQTYSPTDYQELRLAARAKIQAMNDDLKARAATAGYAVADVHALTIRMEDEVPLRANGQTFLAAANPENLPHYLFCKDGFHPATVAQSLIANEVIGALNQALGTSIAPLANREVMRLIPGLDPDQPFLDWIAGQGVAERGLHDNPEGDAFDNLAEFAFGLHAGSFDPGLGHDWSGLPGERRFGLSWTLNPAADGYLEVVAERSADLGEWTPLAPGEITDLGGGMWRASIGDGDPAAFLRARVELAP